MVLQPVIAFYTWISLWQSSEDKLLDVAKHQTFLSVLW